MENCSFPTSNTGFLPRVLDGLENEVKIITNKNIKAGEALHEATPQQLIVAWLVSSVVAFVIAAVDEIIHTTLIAVKAVPVLFNQTIGKLTGLDKYFTDPGLSLEDFFGHFERLKQCLAVQFCAVPAFLCLIQPSTVVAIANDIKVLPLPAEKKQGKGARCSA